MKSRIFVAVMIAMAGMTTLPVEAGNQGAYRPNRMVVAPASITSEEAATLLWMREEEKLARDVYQALYAQYKQPVFLRIARSEQRHFDAMGKQITRFGVADPASSFAGVFSKDELQDLYLQLVAEGSQGYVQALTVGAAIEDIDIADLIVATDATTDPILKRTYDNLLEGSKNHMRAFVTLLRLQGADYTPVHIDEALFDAIMDN